MGFLVGDVRNNVTMQTVQQEEEEEDYGDDEDPVSDARQSLQQDSEVDPEELKDTVNENIG